jgi:group I intron endonuclease
MIGIYQIECNKKAYIGSSFDIDKRWRNHHNELKRNVHINKHLQRAYNLYGDSSLSFSVLEEVEDRNHIVEIEQKYIDKLKPYYNIRLNAANNYGYKHSAEARAKMSEACKGRTFSAEARLKMSIAHKGMRASDKARMNMSAAQKNSSRIHVISEEAKAKISKTLTGRKLQDETKVKLSNARKGHKLSAEIKAKISAANKISYNTKEAKERISQQNKKNGNIPPSRKGSKWTDEQKQIARDKRAKKKEEALK